MRRHASISLALLVSICSLADPCGAQTGSASQALPSLPANDSIYRRARRLVSDGNGAAGRAVVDSMVRASAEGTPSYGDAIFWRGALAETAAEAERDYRRVIVEYPLSPYADDALLSLAELEQARGDRTAAYQHLQRFVREHPISPARARAGLAAARLAFEQRDMTHGCAMIADARTSAGASDVELRNQIEYYGGHCPTTASAQDAGPNVAASTVGAPAAAAPATNVSSRSTVPTTAPAKATASPAKTTPPPKSTTTTSKGTRPPARAPEKTAPAKPVAANPDSSRPVAAKSDSAPQRATAVSPSTSPRGVWTIQLAAYNTRPDAERLAAKLATRGVKARITGESKPPFRVRLDHYATRQEAAAVVAELKQRGIIGFVTEEPTPSGASSP